MQLSSELQTPPRTPVQVVGRSRTPAIRESGGPARHPDPRLAAAPSTGKRTVLRGRNCGTEPPGFGGAEERALPPRS